MSHFHLPEGPQIWMTFYFYFLHSVENEKIVLFMLFRPKITHSFVLGWNLKRNPVETPNEMPQFTVLEGPQIWMTFYFYFFHSVDNEIIVSFKFFRPKIIHSYIRVWNFKRNPKRNVLKPQNEMYKIRKIVHLHSRFSNETLKGRKFEWLFTFIFFHSVDNEIIVSFNFFRLKIIHSYIRVWNFKRNPVETPKEMSHFHLLEGPQIWMTIYFNFFHSVENELIV
jgi:hypothetical protein